MTFGRGGQNFLVNSSAAVAQCVKTRLNLSLGEFYADTSAGIDWYGAVLGTGTKALYDLAIKNCILGTQGVAQNGVLDYASSLDSTTRKLTVTCRVLTIYSNVPVDISTSILVGQGFGTIYGGGYGG